MIDLAAKLAAVEASSAQLFLRRQDIQLELQKLQAVGAQIERELTVLSGEVRVLKALQAEALSAKAPELPRG